MRARNFAVLVGNTGSDNVAGVEFDYLQIDAFVYLFHGTFSFVNENFRQNFIFKCILLYCTGLFNTILKFSYWHFKY